jgi:hypothetical protein
MSDVTTIERDTKTGRFLTGNRGGARPRGSRVKHTENFLAAFCRDFEENGADVIRRVREDDPSTYLKVASSLLPRESQLGVDIDVTIRARSALEAYRMVRELPRAELREIRQIDAVASDE